MELTPQQVKDFADLHKNYPAFQKYSEAEVREIANGVANYYRTLFRSYQRLKKEGVDFEDVEELHPNQGQVL